MSKDIKYVTLPYDFIPLPDKYYYPYDKEQNYPPLHSEISGISGYIKYSLTPKTDISVELRDGLEAGKRFISGSYMRGRVRANLEILSKSYPEFINTTPMLYRAVADSKELGKFYKNRLCNQEKNSTEQADIERKIYVGFLRKDVNDFYVVPAEGFSNDRKFLSIKEHRLYSMDMKMDTNHLLYKENIKFDKLNQIQLKINKLDEEITNLRKKYKYELKYIQKKIDRLFTIDYSFTKQLNKNKLDINNYNNYLEGITQELYNQLKQYRKYDDKLDIFFKELSQRWNLKAIMDLEYRKMKKNQGDEFEPYQKVIFYQKTNNDGIADISVTSTRTCTEKGYIYNSTNASSKRSHYIINKPVEGNTKYNVPPEIINSYNQNHKKFRVTFEGDKDKLKDMPKEKREERKIKEEKIKEFYNIFTDYEKLIKNNSGTSEGLIVFFQLNKDKANEISMIGRTPYFKIPYEHSLRDIIGNKGENNIDYADAIFGFISNNANESKSAYKSRVRFSAIDIEGSIEKEDRDFLLTTPTATACAMYLKQSGASLSTYEDKKPPELNGYKYYRVLGKAKAQADTVPEDRSKVEKMISNKEVIIKDCDLKLEGRIYFSNLNENELGLLLLSLDIRKLSTTSKYKDKLEQAGIDVSSTYEQIGGAKPYGYGAVEVKKAELYLEDTGSSFEALISDNMQKSNTSEELDCTKYIDIFLTEMLNHQEKYFDYIKPYIESKREKPDNGDCITWANIESKKDKSGGGYPENWRLETHNTKIK